MKRERTLSTDEGPNKKKVIITTNNNNNSNNYKRPAIFTKKYLEKQSMQEFDLELFKEEMKTWEVPHYFNVPAWNFDITLQDHIVLSEKYQQLQFNFPSPYVEHFRAQEILKLRKEYLNDCKRLLEIDAPSESYNRFLFEQLSLTLDEIPKGCFLFVVFFHQHTASLITSSYIFYMKTISNNFFFFLI